MLAAPIPANDAERLESLHRMDLLSTPREADLDRLVRLARSHFDVEIALISLIDKDRQWFKARAGLDICETSREISFCGHAIHHDDALIVPNALEDERFFDNPAVTGDLAVRFYAGQPLTNKDGFKIGTFCIVSATPREFSDKGRQSLYDLARLAEMIIENRTLSAAQSDMIKALEMAERDSMIDVPTGLWNKRGLEEILDREVERAKREGASIALCKASLDAGSIGDEAVKKMAEKLVAGVRASDIVVRYGETDFVILMPGLHAVSLPGLGDKLVRSLNANGVSASFGLTLAKPSGGATLTGVHMVQRADEALAQAKAAGGNRAAIVDVPDAFYSDVAFV